MKELKPWFGILGMDLHATAELIQLRDLIFSFHCHRFTQPLSHSSLGGRVTGTQIALFPWKELGPLNMLARLCVEQSACWDPCKNHEYEGQLLVKSLT